MDDERRRAEREVERRPRDPVALLALGCALARSGERAGAARAYWRAGALGGAIGEVRAGLRALDAPPSPWSQVLGDASNAQATHALGPRRGDRAVCARVPGGSGRSAAVDEDGSIWVATAKAEVTRFTPALAGGYRNRADACEDIAALATRSGGALASDGHALAVVRRQRPRGSTARRLDTAAVGPIGVARVTPGGLIVAALDDGRGFRAWRGEAWEVRTVDDGPRSGDALPFARRSPLAAVQGERVAFAHAEGPLFVCALDGRVVARVEPEGAWACPPAFAADGTLLALALPGARPDVVVVVAIGSDGRTRWRRDLATRLPPERDHRLPSLALGPDGGAYVMLRDALVRLDAAGGEAWRRPGDFCHQQLDGPRWVGGAVVDGVGVLYTMDGHDLVAIEADGDEVFRRSARVRGVVGLDALERVLVFDTGQDLLAIGDRDGPSADLQPAPLEGREGEPIDVPYVAW